MSNLALGKKIEEEHYNGASLVTNGQTEKYSAWEGFCDFPWPNYLTLDLERVCLVKQIRFLLWDNLGEGNVRDNRVYCYRLLASKDHVTWEVVFDTLLNGHNGWQNFLFPNGIELRFIRIHGLWNSANAWFHVVELEVHDEIQPQGSAEYTLERTIDLGEAHAESGDALPLERNVTILINRLEKLLAESDILNPEPIRTIISRLRTQVKDVSIIESNLESVRREIIQPVHKELEESSEIGRQSLRLGQFSRWGFIVGIVGGILAIISIILTLTKNAP